MSFDLKVIDGDLVIKNGQLDTVTGTDKLTQDILKIVLTTIGSNPFHPFYGSFISRTLIGSYLDTDILFTMAQSQLQVALETLKALQNIQLSSLQKMSADEQIAAITDVSVNRNKFDPRLIDIIIKVTSKAFTRSEARFQIKSF